MRHLLTWLTLLAYASAHAGHFDPAALDRSFGRDPSCGTGIPGQCAIHFDVQGSLKTDEAISLLPASNGDYFVVGNVAVPGGKAVGVARLDQQGRRVVSFDEDGRTVLSLGLQSVTAAGIDQDDRIYVTGSRQGPGFAVKRITEGGADDPTFGGAASAISCGGTTQLPTDIVIGDDGVVRVVSIYLTGTSEGLPSGVCITSLNSSGGFLGMRKLENSSTIRYDAGAIDVTSMTFALAENCAGANCAGRTTQISILPIDDIDSALASFSLLDGPDCAATDLHLANSITTPDRTTVLARHGAGKDTLLLSQDASGVVSQQCQLVASDVQVKEIARVAEASPDIYLIGVHQTAPSHVDIDRLMLNSDGTYAEDQGFGGAHVMLAVPGADEALRGTTQSPFVQGRFSLTQALARGPRLTMAATRVWEGADTDFVIARMGDDPAVFIDGLESLPE